GYGTVIVLSVLWAACTTLISGFMATLAGFVALRILTGLGEGVYYSNDRSLIAATTPPERWTFGMGVAITGLSVGATLTTLLAPFLLSWGEHVFGTGEGWRMPFFAFSIPTFAVAFGIWWYLRTRWDFQLPLGPAFLGVGRYALVLFILIFAVFFIADGLGLPNWLVATIETVFALALIAFSWLQSGDEMKYILKNRNIMLLSASMIPVLWNLWFFGFWSVAIVANAAHTSFLQAALTATFNGLAGVIGYPFGGWAADYAQRKGRGRKAILLWFTLLQGLLTLVFGLYLMAGGHSTVVMGALLFAASFFFNALQPINHVLLGDNAEPSIRGAAFGMYNLIGEIGAVLSPVIGGTLRDIYHSWTPAIMLDVVLIFVSFLLIVFVKEHRKAEAQ
ncbi:MAG: MFS transporter, partial [Alicyclobacillaceae bacterium]|nr:MFS transporter [Alicyclobacillaceae bacterium]